MKILSRLREGRRWGCTFGALGLIVWTAWRGGQCYAAAGGGSGAGAGVPSTYLQPAAGVATKFADQQKIADRFVREDLINFASVLQVAGIYVSGGSGTTTNLTDALFLHPRYNPSNFLSWAGSAVTFSNVGFSQWGASFNANGLIKFAVPDSRTNTLIVVWRGYQTNYNIGKQQFLAGLVNNSPAQYAAQWFYMPNNVLQWAVRETNTQSVLDGDIGAIAPWWGNIYHWSEVGNNLNQRRVTMLSHNGAGIYQAWNNGAAAQIGATAQKFYLTNTAVLPQQPLNLMILGGDVKGPASGFFGGYYQGEIAWVGVLNNPVSTNMAQAILWALRELEPETDNNLFLGDSLFASGSTISNNPPQMVMDSSINTNKTCWINLAQGGTKISQWNNATTSNNLFYLWAPRGKVLTTRFVIAGGINDFYGNGDSINTVSNNLFAILGAAAPNGIRTTVLTVAPLWTNSNAYVYSGATEALVDGFNNVIISNTVYFSDVVRRDLIVTQDILNTNTAGFSLDGLHLFNTNGWVINRKIANQIITSETIINENAKQVLTVVTNPIMGDVGVTGAIFGKTGTLTKLVNYTVVASDAGLWFNNTGAVGVQTNTLPAATVGLHYGQMVDAAQFMCFRAVGTDTIRNAASVSTAAGGIFANTIGNSVHLTCHVAGKWSVDAIVGSWTTF